MKCFICKREFDEDDLVGLEITPQDELGNGYRGDKENYGL